MLMFGGTLACHPLAGKLAGSIKTRERLCASHDASWCGEGAGVRGGGRAAGAGGMGRGGRCGRPRTSTQFSAPSSLLGMAWAHRVVRKSGLDSSALYLQGCVGGLDQPAIAGYDS